MLFEKPQLIERVTWMYGTSFTWVAWVQILTAVLRREPLPPPAYLGYERKSLWIKASDECTNIKHLSLRNCFSGKISAATEQTSDCFLLI